MTAAPVRRVDPHTVVSGQKEFADEPSRLGCRGVRSVCVSSFCGGLNVSSFLAIVRTGPPVWKLGTIRGVGAVECGDGRTMSFTS